MFILHFAAISMVCLSETASIRAKNVVVAPALFDFFTHAIKRLSVALGALEEPAHHPVGLAVATYLNAAGIEAGYGYFAPNVPETYALVFECRYPNGRIDYQTPSIRSAEAQLRLTTLLEQIGRTNFAPSRDEIIRLLARSTWQRHYDAVAVRGFFGSIEQPSIAEFRAGQRDRTFNCLYVYDFSRDP
ncbi:MAG: hypothetical protein ABIU29_11040 [Chthoniobacterales bacterium]